MDGDEILVSNGQDEPEIRVVSVKDKIATISTNLTGPLKAVYPANAANLDGNEIKGVSVSPTQTGTFADANICMAEGITDKAVFENKTAVLRFYVGSEIKVTSVTLESFSESFAPNIGQKITVEAPDGKTLYDQMPENQDRRICYVAVPYGGHEQLTITTTAETQTPEPKKLTKCTLEVGNMYTVFIPYYIDLGDAGKWAYCNIGAFLPEEPGLYFAWGGTTGYKWDAQSNRFEDGHWFDWERCPFNDGKSYCNYPIESVLAEICTNIEGTHYVLNPGYDAAYQKWGEKWRMPTSGDAKKLFESTNTTKEDVSGNVLTIHGSSLKIPASGSSNSDNPTGDDGTVLTYYKEKGYLWTSSMSYNRSTDYYEPNYAMAVSFTTDNVSTTGMERKFGLPIRPIYCEPAPHESEDDSDLLSGKFSVGNKTIMFSKGNLYWDGSSYQFESNQYDYRQYYGIQGDAAVISGISGTTPKNTVGTFWWVPNHLVDEYTKPYSEAPASNLGSRDDDIIFTNSNGTTANPKFTVNGKSGKYRTFTADEMAAILFDRTDECRFAKAKVMGVNGLFIFPDDYSLPSGYSTEGGNGMSAINIETEPFPETNVPNDTWTKMELDGVVFLPAAGYRTSYFFPNIMVNGSGIGGYYWTNSLHGTGYNYEDATAGFMEFTGEDIDQNKNGYRKTGYSIRLVMDVSNN